MNNLTVTEYKNIRVLTTQQIAEAYGTMQKLFHITSTTTKIDMLMENIIFA